MSDNLITKQEALDLIHDLEKELSGYFLKLTPDHHFTTPYEVSRRMVETMLKKDLITPLEAINIFESSIKNDEQARKWLNK
jgi:hypothetical protein